MLRLGAGRQGTVAQEVCDDADRQTDDAEVAPFDAGDGLELWVLHRVSTSFIEWIAGGDVA